MPPLIKDRCINCGKCYEICPGDVFQWSGQKKKPIVTYPEECWHCGACRLECPSEAIDYLFPLGMTHV
jgi:adenylylsulfate reductase, subunit B